MNQTAFSCICADDNDKTLGVTLDQNPCCKKETKELSNTNNIFSFTSEIKYKLSSDLIGVINPAIFLQFNSLQISAYNHFNDRIPPPDITITTSSLQI